MGRCTAAIVHRSTGPLLASVGPSAPFDPCKPRSATIRFIRHPSNPRLLCFPTQPFSPLPMMRRALRRGNTHTTGSVLASTEATKQEIAGYGVQRQGGDSWRRTEQGGWKWVRCTRRWRRGWVGDCGHLPARQAGRGPEQRGPKDQESNAGAGTAAATGAGQGCAAGMPKRKRRAKSFSAMPKAPRCHSHAYSLQAGGRGAGRRSGAAAVAAALA